MDSLRTSSRAKRAVDWEGAESGATSSYSGAGQDAGQDYESDEDSREHWSWQLGRLGEARR